MALLFLLLVLLLIGTLNFHAMIRNQIGRVPLELGQLMGAQAVVGDGSQTVGQVLELLLGCGGRRRSGSGIGQTGHRACWLLRRRIDGQLVERGYLLLLQLLMMIKVVLVVVLVLVLVRRVILRLVLVMMVVAGACGGCAGGVCCC